METMYYIGLDVHKKTISYCVKDGSGRIYGEGSIPATRLTLDMWMKTLPQPWTVAMEADHLHGLDLRSSQAACRSSEGGASADATSDCGGQEKERPHRCQKDCRLPALTISCRSATWPRRKFANDGAPCAIGTCLVRQAVQMKNKIAVLLMEAGVSYNKQKLHKVGYFRELLATNQDIDEGPETVVTAVPGDGGAPGENGKCAGAIAGARLFTCGTRGTAHDHSGGWTDHCVDVGAGSW